MSLAAPALMDVALHAEAVEFPPGLAKFGAQPGIGLGESTVCPRSLLLEWVMNDGSLDFTSVRTVNRTVMRDAVVTSLKVCSLVSRDPIVFRVAVDVEGVYYEVDRRSEQVLRGDARKRRPITFAFD